MFLYALNIWINLASWVFLFLFPFTNTKIENKAYLLPILNFKHYVEANTYSI